MDNVAYRFGERPEELKKLLNKQNALYRTRISRIIKMYNLVEDLRETLLWKSPLGKCEYSFFVYDSGDSPTTFLYIRTYEYPIDMIIDFFCSVLHQKYGILWEMENDDRILTLKALYERIIIHIMVSEGENAQCKLVKKFTGTNHFASFDAPQHEYVINCDGVE